MTDLTRGPVAALTGVGVSAESGVPVFRGDEGLWHRHRPEELATPDAFQRRPRRVWEWYNCRRQLISECRPNAAHETLAATEEALPGWWESHRPGQPRAAA